MDHPRIASARNDVLVAEDGREYVDLFSAHGAAWLGHANPEIAAAVAAQLERVWLTGGLETSVFAGAKAAVESFFPDSHALAALYSTGMEAAEFAIRVARVVTGRNGVVGFEGSMHGKSLATAYLGWDNRDGLHVPLLHRLPFIPRVPEDQVLRRLEETLTREPVSAVFVEPVQGSAGGHVASPRFCREVFTLCRARGALLVFDEILTGFYRLGSPFAFSTMGFVPDVVLIGKAMGSGFPVSGVVVDRAHPIRKEMLPGSTYAGNALAASAVLATLRRMRTMDLPAMVAAIERTIAGTLGRVRDAGMPLRGKGALWVVELPPDLDAVEVALGIARAGVRVGLAGRHLRILPAATIEPDHLASACSVVAEELLRAHERGHGR